MTNKGIICRSISVAILFSGFCVSAGAAVVQYTNQSSFTTATSGVTTITFGPAGSSTTMYNNSSGYTNDGATFVGYDNTTGQAGSYDLKDEDVTPDWGSGAYLDGPGSFGSSADAGITVTLPSNTFAIATNIMASSENPEAPPASDAANFQILLSTGSTVYTVTSLSGYTSMAFVGFTSDTAITSITFNPQSSTDRTELDNFQFGQTAGQQQTSATPEASTLLLCGGGLLLMVRFLRRCRSMQPASAAC